MRFFTGVLVGLVAAIALPASATVGPETDINHPTGTIGPVFMPFGCDEVKRVHLEEHLSSRIGVTRAVREVHVLRLQCDRGDRRRTMVVRGSWQPAYVTQ